MFCSYFKQLTVIEIREVIQTSQLSICLFCFSHLKKKKKSSLSVSVTASLQLVQSKFATLFSSVFFFSFCVVKANHLSNMFTCCCCAATRPCNQHTALTPAHQIRSEIFDCAMKEGTHYDLARTIYMLHSAEWEWCPPSPPQSIMLVNQTSDWYVVRQTLLWGSAVVMG